ncbi:disk-shape morphogenesis protein volactin [Natronorubrum daqingense]|uniref:t-SNARE coiled-coil homology domain-containing protein n=1 Tax=Natronorubrum daqingense TaxID=588898 RepID=A0A1N6XSU3_9EURY|nr:ATP-binding protein [Natronorubrum daqingense]APX95869.1 hypothetical protein BB347_04140 [Natronorubrum daqingense]SIR05422.1 Protein of unknown function [Natronorubrum daqingense]
MEYGLDIGPEGLRVASGKGEGTVDSVPPVVVSDDEGTLEEQLDASGGTVLVESEGATYAVGSAAISATTSGESAPKSLFSNGVLTVDAYAESALDALVDELIDADGNEVERLCYTTPGRLVDVSEPTEAHRETVDAVFTERDIDATPISRGFAVVYDQLRDENHTGLGLCLGTQTTSVTLAYYGVPALAFSLAKGSDWVVDRAATACEVEPSHVATILEGFRLEPDAATGDVESALAQAYDALIAEIVDEIEAEATESDVQQGLGISMALAGEGAVEGLEYLLGGRFDAAPLPFSVQDVRLADEPSESATRGALAAARDDVDSYEDVVWPGADADDAGDAASTTQPTTLSGSDGQTTLSFDESTGGGGRSEHERANDAIDQLFDRLANRDEEIQTLEGDLEAALEELSALEERAATAESVDELGGELETVRADVRDLEAKNETFASADSLAEFTAETNDELASVSDTLETLEADFEAEHDSLSATIETLEGTLGDLESKLEADIETLESALETDIETLETALETERDSLERVDETVQSLETRTATLSDRLDEQDAELAEVSAQLEDGLEQATDERERLEEDLDAVAEALETTRDALEDELNSVSDRLGTLDDDLETLDDRVETLDDGLETTATTTERLDEHQRATDDRVEAVENSVSALETDIESVSADVQTTSDDVDGIEADVDTVAADIETVAADVDTVVANVDTVESTVETLETDVQAVTSEIDEVDSTIDERVGGVENRLESLREAVDELEAGSVEAERVEADLTARLDELEAEFENALVDLETASDDRSEEFEARFDSLETDSNEIETGLEALEAELESLGTELSSLQDADAGTDHGARIDGVENTVVDVADRVDRLESRFGKLEEQTSSHDERLEETTATVDDQGRRLADQDSRIEAVMANLESLEEADAAREAHTGQTAASDRDADLEELRDALEELREQQGAQRQPSSETRSDDAAGLVAPTAAGGGGAGLVAGGALAAIGEPTVGGVVLALGIVLLLATALLGR